MGNLKATQLELFDVLEDDGRPGLRECPVDGLVVAASQADHQSAAVRNLQDLTLCPVFVVLAATKRTVRNLLTTSSLPSPSANTPDRTVED